MYALSLRLDRESKAKVFVSEQQASTQIKDMEYVHFSYLSGCRRCEASVRLVSSSDETDLGG